jgi:hypothetical protein
VLKNYGFSTAFIVEFGARFLQTDTKDIAPDYARCTRLWYAESIEASKFSPAFGLQLEPNPILTEDEIIKIRKGESFLHFYGFVNHRDVFDNPWTSTIHCRWKMNWGGVIKGTVTEFWEAVGGPEENKEAPEWIIFW